MIVNIKIDNDIILINEGFVKCDNIEIKNIINNVLIADPNSSPNKGFYPQIFDLFKDAELLDVIDEDIEVQF